MTDYRNELDSVDGYDIAKVAHPLGTWGVENALKRYEQLRRRGHSPKQALRYTLIWCRNSLDQKDGRLAHETGAINWI